MPDVLSQEEIDELLSAISSGNLDVTEIEREESNKRIRRYDFKRPNKFSKDQLRTLQILHENFARLLSSSFTAHLRTMVNFKIVSVDHFPYEEYMRSIPNPNMLTVFSLAPLQGNSILEIPPAVAFPIIDRLMGGPGFPPDVARPLSEIEQVIMGRVVLRILDALQEAWKNVVDFRPKIEAVENNPMLAQIVAPNEVVVVISALVKLGECEGMISLCLPFLVLEPKLGQLNLQHWFSGVKPDNDGGGAAVLRQQVSKVAVPVSVRLSETRINIRDLLGLQVGDVIQTDAKVNQDIHIVVGKAVKFLGQLGTVGHNLAVQITAFAGKGDEDKNG
ncbi:MAG: flagellar motor switch protein FliM [bacterium]|jgi:flagellar motor switch protein FliM